MTEYPEGTEEWAVGGMQGLANCQHVTHIGNAPARCVAFEGELDHGGDGELYGDAVHFWRRTPGSGENAYNPDLEGGYPSAADFVDTVEHDVAAIEDVTAASGEVTVGFDLFDSQTGGSWSSTVTFSHHTGANWVTGHTIRLPEMDMSTRDPVGTMNQLGHFLLDVPLPRDEDTATIYNGVAQFHHAADKGRVNRGHPEWWSGTRSDRFTAFIEELVAAFVNGSTADTLDQYPEALE